MANEIGLGLNLVANKGGISINRNFNESITMSGSHENQTVMDVTTSAANIPLGSIATAGLVLLHNLDPTNFILIGSTVSASFVGPFKIKPGEAFPVRFNPSITLQAKADTATCQMEIIALED